MLKGVTVLDLSRHLPGPFASLRLADMGAEIIKIEGTLGDPARTLGPDLEGVGALFLGNNRRKKSIAINLKSREGIEIVQQLAEKADIFIESYRPGIADAMGLGYETIKKRNGQIIYCSLTGYGQNGSWRNKGGHDLNYMAVSGMLSLLRDGHGKPVMPSIPIADLLGGMAASEAILAGLVKRSVTGEGIYLDVSMVDQLIGLQGPLAILQHHMGHLKKWTKFFREIVCYHIYETKDGAFVALAALEEKFWKNFCLGVGRYDWLNSAFVPALDGEIIYEEIKELFLMRTLEEWVKFALEIDCCLSPVLDCDGWLNHQYIRDRGLATEARYPLDSSSKLLQVKTSAGGWRDDKDISNIPLLGEHTIEILSSKLGATSPQLEEWQKLGIIG
ncbi:CoA transferase [Microaerobacter geothermalis]|uniref:CaiB/BaiF CoA transferase family protein n=1 Tax=Microaerobacter geothermalis TaxID=674972 RepID=UPI001F4066D4|nr:CoA transferase [Microaerobacter geothermalis]MCF6094999.1 CoA transferase [Microaerobacter geothermalis]